MKPTYFVFLFSSVLALLFTKAQFAQAFVQIETGKVVQQVTDLELSDGSSLFTINRHYIHGGKNKSLLGANWCFDFEEEIRSENDGYRVIVCGQSSDAFFKPEKGHFSYEGEKIYKTKSGQFRRVTETEIIKYNEMGQMISKTSKEKNSSSIRYYYAEDDRIEKISYINQYEIEFNYDSNKKLSSITSKGRRIAAYSVIEENLISVKNGLGEEYKYDYDDLGYLTHVKYPGNLHEEFSYSGKTKLVSKQVTTEGCSRDYDYTMKAQGRLDLKMEDSCVKDRPLLISFSEEIKALKAKSKAKNRHKRKTKEKEQNSSIVVKRDDQRRINMIEDQIKTWLIEYKSENKILAITEINKETNKSKVYKAKYKNGQIAEFSGKGKDKVRFMYSKSGEFLKIKADTKNKKTNQKTIAKFELIRAVVGAN